MPSLSAISAGAFVDVARPALSCHFIADLGKTAVSSLSTLQLRSVETAKVDCARKFFASLNEKLGEDVKYDVVTDYTRLLQLVAG
jgi:hypothetical protein